VLDYRVSPYRHPVPLGDAQRAIRLLRHHAADWQIDPGHVGILGFSAGGHCATSAATHFDPGRTGVDDPVDGQSCRPDLLVACYPVISFGKYRHHGSMLNLLADAQGQVDPVLQEQLSLENRVTAQTPPAFLWHTSDDAGVPVTNSLLYAEALYRCGIPCELHVFPKGRHGLGLAADDPVVGQWTSLCARWLQTLGFGQGPQAGG
jgi:acetyl esterase/lipase